MNSHSVKGGLISSPLFLLKENAILPMTVKAGCDGTPLNLLNCSDYRTNAKRAPKHPFPLLNNSIVVYIVVVFAVIVFVVVSSVVVVFV